MKQKFLAAALLAALLTGLAACAKDAPEPAAPDAPAVTEPEPTETPVEPGTPSEPAPEPAPEPAAPAEPEPPSAPGEPAAAVEPSGASGDIEELLSYSYEVPHVTLGDAEAEAAINDYYDSVGVKYYNYAAADLCEEAQAGALTGFEADYTVTYNAGHILSIRRELREGEHGETVTVLSETFNTDDGGLLVAGDFFTEDEDVWTARLCELVIGQLEPEAIAVSSDLWRDNVRAAFDRDRFYLTETGYVVCYPAGALGSAPVEVELPYEALGGLFRLP